MFVNLFASIEAELNKVIAQQQQDPRDVNLATKKTQLLDLAKNYLQLEGQYKEIVGSNSVY